MPVGEIMKSKVELKLEQVKMDIFYTMSFLLLLLFGYVGYLYFMV